MRPPARRRSLAAISTIAALGSVRNLVAKPHPTMTVPFAFGSTIGNLDEIAIYDKVLTADRVLAHYARQ